MAALKAHEVERYVGSPDTSHRVILVYGPDRGLVAERAQDLARLLVSDPTDPFSTMRLDADEAASDPARIADEAHTVSMFGGQRLIWIRGSTQKNLTRCIEPVLAVPPQDSVVLVEAGDLKKSAPLRTRIEKSSSAIALPCYQDQDRALDSIIDQELAGWQQEITQQARSLLKGFLGGDRLASRSEVQKLCLYAGQGETIDEDMVLTISGDAAALNLDAVLDAAGTGNIAAMDHMLKRLIAQGTPVVRIIMAMQQHVQALHRARNTMDDRGTGAQSAVAAIRPPVNFRRKDDMIKTLSLWNRPGLERLLERIERVSLEARSNAQMGPSLVSTALFAMAVESRQRAARRS